MTTATYQVTGMTCDHCVRAVTTELVLLEGVRSVDVDLAQGAVTVTSDGPLRQGLLPISRTGRRCSPPCAGRGGL